MQCPNCYSEVTASRFCTRCGAQLQASGAAAKAASPPAPASAELPFRPAQPDVGAAYASLLPQERPASVPLSAWQKAQLLGRCVPFLFLTLATIAMATIFPRFVSMPPLAFFLVMGLAILATGYQSLQSLRDVASGVALVREDVLERSRRSSGSSPARYYGHFTQLGRLRLKPSVHFQSHNGKRYYVIYSPASKYVWALETADPFMAYLEQRKKTQP